MPLHKNIGTTNNHIITSFEYANAAARTGATGLTSADIDKVAKQLDNNSYWALVDESPVTWIEFTSSTVGAHATSAWWIR